MALDFPTREERIAHNGTAGAVVWFTGLPAAGKSTVAAALERNLFALGVPVLRLDGDELRRGLCSDLGYAPADRTENIRRAASVAALVANAGSVCLAAFISPRHADRELARTIVSPNCFIEVYVATPISVCKQRDRKGNYARAVRGELMDFTGISAPYEPPHAPDVTLHPDQESVSESVDRILRVLLHGASAQGRPDRVTRAPG